MKPELYLDMHCEIGEGPHWDSETGTLYFVDLLQNKIYSYDGNSVKSMTVDQNLGAVVVRKHGGLAAVMQHGYYLVDFPDGEILQIADPEKKRDNSRFNDGKADACGRFWGGTMSKALDTGYGVAGPESGLYCLDTDGNCTLKLGGVIQGNGMGWSPDNTKMYFIDSQLYTVQAFDFDLEKGELSNGKTILTFPRENGMPDGMTVDAEGMLWVCLWGGGKVIRYNPETGETLAVVELPVVNVTSCAFGGPQMTDLFITTAAMNSDQEQYPHSGGVFVLHTDIKGQPSCKYGG